jgi:hypothetical protein
MGLHFISFIIYFFPKDFNEYEDEIYLKEIKI